MQPQLIDEMLHLVFDHVKKNPALFVNFFGSSEIISAFVYDHKRKSFIYLSSDLKNLSGHYSDSMLPNSSMVKRYIHPNDKLIYQRYFENEPEPTQVIEDAPRYNRIAKMKCRIKFDHANWKVCTFFSFDFYLTSKVNFIKVGIIVQENYKSGEKVFFLFKNKLLTLVNSLEMGEQKAEYKIKDTELKIISKRESEILELIGEGLITKQIANRLNISPTTVITHRNNLKSKIHAKNTAELINKANHLMLL